MFSKIIKQIPNIVTYLRGILGITLVPALFFTGNIIGSIIAFSVLASTDLIDGFLARVLNAATKHGKEADPFMDKLLGGMGLFTLCFTNIVMILPLIMELSIGIHGIISYKKNPTNKKVLKLGKIKMVLLMLTIVLGYINIFVPSLLYAILPLLAITLPLQVITFINYIKNSKEKQGTDLNIEKTEEQKEEQKLIKEENLKEVKSLKKSFTLKDKITAIKNEIERLITEKETFERRLGENFSRKLKR